MSTEVQPLEPSSLPSKNTLVQQDGVQWLKSAVNPASMKSLDAKTSDGVIGSSRESNEPRNTENENKHDLPVDGVLNKVEALNITENIESTKDPASLPEEHKTSAPATPTQVKNLKDDHAPTPPPKDSPKDWLAASAQSFEARSTKNTTAMNVMSGITSTSRLGIPLPLPSGHSRSMSASSILDGHEDTPQDEKSEIQDIMSQFSHVPTGDGSGDSEVNNNIRPIPPRTSSLDNLKNISPVISNTSPRPEKPSHIHIPQTSTPQSKEPIPATPAPPAPDPEPPLPFDFHRFLEQLRHRTADPVAKFLRSFLQEFSKKQWQVHEQGKIISDFLIFIHGKMAQCDVWRGVSDDEFDNAKEGMEKLVMNRLYSQTFSPAIPPPQVPLTGSMRLRARRDGRTIPGRQGQHQEDIEKDEVLSQKAAIYGWVKEEHLDIKPVSESGRKFLSLAVQELLKINNYRAPRDKVICVLNCCKVIFGLLRHSKSTQSADDFIPLLIYVVLQANPEHLYSNIQYIIRFRNPDKLSGEAGYYLSSLSGAVQFIENLDRNSLTCENDDFEKNVEEAVRRIAEKQDPVSPVLTLNPAITKKEELSEPSSSVAKSNGDDTKRNQAQPGSLDRSSQPTNQTALSDETDAVTGLLRTIQRPLTTIGRIFSDDTVASGSGPSLTAPTLATLHDRHGPVSTPRPGNTPRHSPVPKIEPLPASHHHPPAAQHQYYQQQMQQRLHQTQLKGSFTAEESAARQASAEAAEAENIQRAEHQNVVAILKSMFPDLDKDVIDDVVSMKEGRVGLAVDACLALSAT